MMQRGQKFYLIFFAVAVVVIVITACASVSADKAYYAALEHYNAEVEQYEAYYQAATPEEQAGYREKVDPLILKASSALNVWGLARKTGSGDAEMAGYIDAKNAMIDALVAIYN